MESGSPHRSLPTSCESRPHGGLLVSAAIAGFAEGVGTGPTCGGHGHTHGRGTHAAKKKGCLAVVAMCPGNAAALRETGIVASLEAAKPLIENDRNKSYGFTFLSSLSYPTTAQLFGTKTKYRASMCAKSFIYVYPPSTVLGMFI